VEISVLGSVGVRRNGADVEIAARLTRLLAALTISNGSVVPTDRLIDVVWNGEPPDGAEKTLRTYVTRLRQALDSDRNQLIVHRQPGYRLDLRPGELDSEIFDDELDQALQLLRTADSATAAALLSRTIARWRGPAYAGFADEDWARPESVRLEERLVKAREALIEARLADGNAEQAVADAQALVESEPLRERPRALLMRTLYSTGRQVEALRVYSSYRRYLVEETGLDPSDELGELETRIARGDPGLDGSSQTRRGYEVGERIGEGAFAVVHRAVQPGIGRDVAIKIIRPELADQPEFIRRFELEARTVARIEHPNVVPLYDFWREPGAAFLVMRWLRGGTVEHALRARGPYSREQTARLLDDVGGAMETAHRSGVVHRDVRPANLLLDTEGTTYLADFGIALPTATADDLPIVSPVYAAPEVLRGEPAGVAADVLSLGVTVFEVLTGRLPFADSTDRADIVRRQLTESLPPAQATRTDLPSQVDDVLARATAKVPDDRYPTVGAFVAAMHAALGVESARPARGVPVMPGRVIQNPFLGLHAFDELDAERFHGRETLITELVDELERRPMVAVVGPSGSGKSSVVRAGLLPAVRRGAVPGSDAWFVTTMVPGTDPVDALETALLRVAVNPPATLREQLAEPGGLLRAIRRVLPDDRARILLVVDQFEELFTQVRDPDHRDRFLTELAAAIVHPASPLRVVATLRADHYDGPLRHRGMADLVTAGTVTVRPMSPEELERAITLPARAVGVELEPALAAELVAGVSALPSALPLLQFSLTELFDRRVDNTMLLSTHHELGRLSGALAARADRIVDAGDTDDESEVRRIFGRLVTLGEGGEDTRRRAFRSEFGSRERTAWLLDAYITARLVTADRDPATREPTIEVAHEALLRDWPRLRDWLAEDRDDLRDLRAIGSAADAWIADDRDTGQLARGARLATATELAARRPDLFNDREAEWVARSRAAAEAEAARTRRRRVTLTSVFAAVALVMTVLAVAALVARRSAARDRDRAEQSQQLAAAAAADADAAAQRELAGRLTAQARTVMADDQELAVLLALAAIEATPEPLDKAIEVLHHASQRSRAAFAFELLPEHTIGQGLGMAMSDDGSLLAVTADGGFVELRNAGGEFVGQLGEPGTGPPAITPTIAFAPATKQLGTIGPDGVVRLLDTESGATIWELATTWNGGGQVAFDASGQLIVAASQTTPELIAIDSSDGREVWRTEIPSTNKTIATGSDGTLLVGSWFANDTGLVSFDIRSGELRASTAAGGIASLAIDAGGMLLVGLSDGTIETRDPATLELLTSSTGDDGGAVQPLVVDPHGAYIAAIGGKGRLLDDTGTPLFEVGPVLSGAGIASIDGDLLYLHGPAPGVVTAFETRAVGGGEAVTVAEPGRAVVGASFADDATLVTQVGDSMGSSVFDLVGWDIRSGAERYRLDGMADFSPFLAVDPTGTIVTAQEDGGHDGGPGTPRGPAVLLDARTGTLVGELDGSDSANQYSFSFTPEGSKLLAAQTDGIAVVFDVATGRRLAELPVAAATGHPESFVLAVSAGREVLATGQCLGEGVVLWDADTYDEVERHSVAGCVGAIAISPDETKVAVGANPESFLIDLATGERHPIPGDAWDVEFSPDGSIIVVAGGDGFVRVHDAGSGELVMTLNDRTWGAFSVEFNPDGSLLAVGGLDGAARVLHTDVADLVASARGGLTRSMTPEECATYLPSDSSCGT
jgi:DNA-binding SARP family transcriptional activator/WD40 repeat protein